MTSGGWYVYTLPALSALKMRAAPKTDATLMIIAATTIASLIPQRNRRIENSLLIYTPSEDP